MKLGLATSFSILDAKKWGKELSSLGCGSVVFPLDYTSSETEINDFYEQARLNNLTIAEVGAWCNPISPSKKEREASIKRCIGQLSLADKIKANCCVNVSGALGEIWDNPYEANLTSEAWNLNVKAIQHIIDSVNPQHTYYTLEPMPWMIPLNPSQYLKLIKDVNRKHFAVHMDVINWITSVEKYFFNEKFMDEIFNTLGDNIKSCHIKDVNLKSDFTLHLEETECGKGNINLEKYAELANSVSVNMPMIIEHLDNDISYRKSLKYVQERLDKYILND